MEVPPKKRRRMPRGDAPAVAKSDTSCGTGQAFMPQISPRWVSETYNFRILLLAILHADRGGGGGARDGGQIDLAVELGLDVLRFDKLALDECATTAGGHDGIKRRTRTIQGSV